MCYGRDGVGRGGDLREMGSSVIFAWSGGTFFVLVFRVEAIYGR